MYKEPVRNDNWFLLIAFLVIAYCVCLLLFANYQKGVSKKQLPLRTGFQ